MSIVTTLLALLIEATVGYPQALVRAIGHPVTWIGQLIGWLDRTLNRESDGGRARRAMGFLALAGIVAVPGVLAYAVQWGLMSLPVVGVVLVAVLASTLIAQRSLYEHVARVAEALEREGLDGGRKAVSQIVGRDPNVLDEAGVSRAAIESLAENFSDGVVAPVCWLAVGGLTGGAIYKAINTADSMIGHRTPRHNDFGYASAKLDDLVNLPASRLSGLLIVAAASITKRASVRGAWETMLRDAGQHRSPNAGYPEAAMAGALGLSLAGPRVYGGVMVHDAAMGDGRRDTDAHDIRAALDLYKKADAILIALFAIPVALFIVLG